MKTISNIQTSYYLWKFNGPRWFQLDWIYLLEVLGWSGYNSRNKHSVLVLLKSNKLNMTILFTHIESDEEESLIGNEE